MKSFISYLCVAVRVTQLRDYELGYNTQVSNRRLERGYKYFSPKFLRKFKKSIYFLPQLRVTNK